LRFDPRVRIAGVILNNVASERHAGYLRDAIREKLRVPILGMVGRERDYKMEERHLGLVPAQEMEKEKRRKVLRNAKRVAEQIDIDGVTKSCGSLPLDFAVVREPARRNRARIAVAMDESFNFYYQDNLGLLRGAGAKLQFFSPINDPALPEGIDGIILGGGFPEVLADRLEKNESMMKSLRSHITDGMPVYCECGGLMYMTKSISGYKGAKQKQKMLGLVDAETVMTGRLTLNYTEADCNAPLFGEAVIRGHEFHYSELRDIGRDTRYAYKVSKGKGIADGKDGIICGDNGLAAYMHLHFGGNGLARNLVDACAAFSRR
jgi:cobyrinic acid a,c-diamide synthase